MVEEGLREGGEGGLRAQRQLNTHLPTTSERLITVVVFPSIRLPPCFTNEAFDLTFKLMEPIVQVATTPAQSVTTTQQANS